MSEALLEVENLRTSFHLRRGQMRAVDGVDFEVGRGRTLCVVGESGSGKSVTALSVMQLIEPPGRVEDGSSIRFEGRELTALGDDQLRGIRGNEISMIFQEPMTSLNPARTVGNQIAEAVRLHRKVSAQAARERAVEMLRLVGVPSPETRADDYPHQLSGGMRQRVMIAMALACEPKLLIADEPTTALDVTIQAQILELIRELRSRLGMSMLLITHNLGVVAEMADDVAVMYAGRIVERGPVAEIFAQPQHPYTEALLRSVPVLGMSRRQRLAVIPGTVPSPLRWPEGCRFAGRCSYRHDRCATYPAGFAVGAQTAACWLCEDGARATAPPVEASA
jgi:peptide/nickel transport system ATP-binding protein/oligopeptide transport system ATP-binding protein